MWRESFIIHASERFVRLIFLGAAVGVAAKTTSRAFNRFRRAIKQQ
jgi:hypothetical protein